MLSRFADWARAIFRSVTVSSARRSKMRCGAPIKTMHPPRRRRSDPSLRSASMALSERRRGQVSTPFRQLRTRNTPTLYQKHPSDAQPFICYVCFSGVRSASRPPPERSKPLRTLDDSLWSKAWGGALASSVLDRLPILSPGFRLEAPARLLASSSAQAPTGPLG